MKNTIKSLIAIGILVTFGVIVMSFLNASNTKQAEKRAEKMRQEIGAIKATEPASTNGADATGAIRLQVTLDPSIK